MRDAFRIVAQNTLARFALLCGTSLCMPAAVFASDVYKCATSSGISYQSMPCQTGVELPKPNVSANVVEAPRSMATVAVKVSKATNAAYAETSTDARSTSECNSGPGEWWRRSRRAICIGMTDDEVLNLPGWGRPAKISRTHVPREWREEWFYDARTVGPRQLWFVNGKLASVETELVENPSGGFARLASN
jgi:hypothetical protein